MEKDLIEPFLVAKRICKAVFPNKRIFIEMEFDGSGDSGDIHSISYYTINADVSPDVEPRVLVGTALITPFTGAELRELDSYEDTPDGNNPFEHFKELGSVIATHHLDWYNNSGAFGHVYIRMDTGEYFVSAEVRVETTEGESHFGKIKTFKTFNI